ncbi:MAG: hypothetical protein AAFY39_01860 [Pseudomonadota bacterium]
MMRLALILCAFATLAPGVARAACTGDLPGTGLLNLYSDATGGGVIGGIGANQCGLEVTDFCTAGRCLTFFDGLSGYADVSRLASGTLDPAPDAFEYDVDGIDGSLTFMGQSQPFDLSGDNRIRVVPQADHVLLSLPDPLPDNIRMTSTGSSGWEAVLPDWVGVPIPVTVYLDRLSAKRATLELAADHQMLKMDMRLALARVGDLPDMSAAVPDTADPVPAAPLACDKTQEIAVSVGQTGEQTRINAYFAAVARVGITDWDNRTEAQCADLLDALEAAGLADSAPQPIPRPVAAAETCDPLIQDVRPILRGPASAEKRAVLSAMVALGVTSIDATNPKHCSEVAAALGR